MMRLDIGFKSKKESVWFNDATRVVDIMKRMNRKHIYCEMIYSPLSYQRKRDMAKEDAKDDYDYYILLMSQYYNVARCNVRTHISAYNLVKAICDTTNIDFKWMVYDDCGYKLSGNRENIDILI